MGALAHTFPPHLPAQPNPPGGSSLARHVRTGITSNPLLRSLLPGAFKCIKIYGKRFVVHWGYEYRSRLKTQGLEKGRKVDKKGR